MLGSDAAGCGDCAVAGGYTPEIIESAAIARQYGARVIAITPAQTPLAEQVDLVLPLLVQESDYIFKPTPSRYAMLAMVDVLATELAMANKAQAKDRLRRIKLVLDSHRGALTASHLAISIVGYASSGLVITTLWFSRSLVIIARASSRLT